LASGSGSSSVEAVFEKIYRMVRREVCPISMRYLLFTRRGLLCSRFPSERVRRWAARVQERYGLGQRESELAPLFLYAVAKYIYKYVEVYSWRSSSDFALVSLETKILLSVVELVYQKTGVHLLISRGELSAPIDDELLLALLFTRMEELRSRYGGYLEGIKKRVEEVSEELLAEYIKRLIELYRDVFEEFKRKHGGEVTDEVLEEFLIHVHSRG